MTEPMKVIVITGTPASGKTTIADKVAKRIGDAEVIHANDIVRSKRLFTAYARDGAMLAQMGRLKKELEKRIRSSKKGVVIVEGHLLCDMRIRKAIAIVVREHLRVLEGRMEKRGYAVSKIKENIISEAIDYCGISAQKNYGQVFEIMNGKRAVSEVTSLIKGMKTTKNGIEMLNELVEFTKREGWNL